MLRQKFPDIYASNRHGFSFQETVAKRLAMPQPYVSRIINAHLELQKQTENIADVNYANGIKNLPEGLVREARKAPEEKKPEIYEAIVANELKTPEVKKLVEAVTEKPEMTKEEINAEAEHIKQEKALPKPETKTEEEIAQERVAKMGIADEKYEAKIERSINKAIAAGSHFPEDLMISVHGHLAKDSKDAKADDEKAEAYAKKVVTIMYERTSEEDLASIFAEADQIP